MNNGLNINDFVIIWDKATSHHLTNQAELKFSLNWFFRPTASPGIFSPLYSYFYKDIMAIEFVFA